MTGTTIIIEIYFFLGKAFELFFLLDFIRPKPQIINGWPIKI